MKSVDSREFVTKGIAYEQVRQAMDRIEAAQSELERACAALSPIVGAVPEFHRLVKLHDRVRGEWFRLEQKLQKGRWRIWMDRLPLDLRRKDGQS